MVRQDRYGALEQPQRGYLNRTFYFTQPGNLLGPPVQRPQMSRLGRAAPRVSGDTAGEAPRARLIALTSTFNIVPDRL